MFTGNLTLWQGLIVCIFSLIVVFIVLLAISYMIDLTAWVLRKLGINDKKQAAPSSAEPLTESAAGEEEDKTALLASVAVVACWEDSDSQFVVRSLRRLTCEETPCGWAGRDIGGKT